MPQTSKTTGKIKFYNENKGYGFIIQDGQENDIFFHIKDSKVQNFTKDDKVEFETKSTPKGISGINVTKIK